MAELDLPHILSMLIFFGILPLQPHMTIYTRRKAHQMWPLASQKFWIWGWQTLDWPWMQSSSFWMLPGQTQRRGPQKEKVTSATLWAGGKSGTRLEEKLRRPDWPQLSQSLIWSHKPEETIGPLLGGIPFDRGASTDSISLFGNVIGLDEKYYCWASDDKIQKLLVRCRYEVPCLCVKSTTNSHCLRILSECQNVTYYVWLCINLDIIAIYGRGGKWCIFLSGPPWCLHSCHIQ